MTNAKRGRPKARGNGDGTIAERPNGKYQIQVTVHGRRITETLPDKTSAKRRLAELTADNARGMIGPPERVTVAEYAERWLSRQHGLRPRSVHLYRTELAYALEHIGALRLRDVRAHHVKDLMARLAEREMKGSRGKGSRGPMSARTLAKVLTRLRSMFREAVTDQVIYVNPADAVKRVREPLQETAGTVLDFHEAARFHELGWALYEAGLCRLWPALLVAISIGARRGEVMGLQWKHVDFDRGVLRIRQARSTDDGAVVTTGAKTLRSSRDVPMPASLKAALERHLKHQEEERALLGAAWAGSGAVFATALGAWTHPSHMNRALETVLRWSDPAQLAALAKPVRSRVPAEAFARLEAAAAAGERLPDLSPHDLRHTYATLALRRKVPLEVVSRTLGHARISITLDVYRHVLESERMEHVLDLFADPVPERVVRVVPSA